RPPFDRFRIWTAAAGGFDLETPDAFLSTPCAGVQASCQPVEAGDFNGDGLVDLLEQLVPSTETGPSPSLMIRLQESPRLFESLPGTSVPSQDEGLFARHSADLDGDGRLDLVTRTSGGYRVQFQRGDGDQLSFEPGSLIIVDGDSNLLGIDDFDGD